VRSAVNKKDTSVLYVKACYWAENINIQDRMKENHELKTLTGNSTVVF
jgi:hypothetical protein